MMRIGLILLAMLTCPAIHAASVDVFLFRHAEKTSNGSKDPGLTVAGKERAARIAEILQAYRLTAIYSTDYERTRQTVEPLSEDTGLAVQLYDPRNMQPFADGLKNRPGTYAIVGHSNTTPALVSLLGGEPHGAINESEYDRLYHLKISEDGIVETELLFTLPRYQPE